MGNAVTAEWFASAPPCSALVPCGPGTHTLRWEAGHIHLPGHPDGEAELILAALGGEKPGCIRLAETWARYAEDLSVLAIGPRSPDDTITATWAIADAAGSGHSFSAYGRVSRLLRGSVAVQARAEQRRTGDLLSLLALGTAFAYRLSGHVAMAHAGQPQAGTRPALTAATEGRIGLAAGEWIGVDPGEVRVTFSDGGYGTEGELRLRLPAGWLASVWACGLTLVDQHLVIDVPEPGWPDARVLALRAPGAEPVLLDVHGTATPDGIPQWEIR